MQHNEKRAELHRLKEKYPEKAAKLEAQVQLAVQEGGYFSGAAQACSFG